jgi:phage baseplate assembly protein gpV
MANTRDRNIDSSKREDSIRRMIDRCEIIAVHPHKSPFNGGSGDRDFNVVDVQLIDRVRCDEGAPVLKRTRLNCLQRDHGLFQGTPWNPRIGDMVLVYWISAREGVVLGTVPSSEQEPVCRSQACTDHQELVIKRSPWEMPERNCDGNFVVFPSPKHPDCFKWWPKTRDYITIHDCPNGHDTPSCCAQAPCNCLDDLQRGTWWKVFSDISPTSLDKPRRVKFHHHCGSVEYWDDDGRVHIENRVAEELKAQIDLFPDGKVEIQSPVEIVLKAPKVTLDTELCHLTGNMQIDGTCKHGACSCDSDLAGQAQSNEILVKQVHELTTRLESLEIALELATWDRSEKVTFELGGLNSN